MNCTYYVLYYFSLISAKIFMLNLISMIHHFFYQSLVFFWLRVSWFSTIKVQQWFFLIYGFTIHFIMIVGCEVNCRRFIESSALAYTISAVTSHEKEVRQVAYQILSRFQQHLFQARFREQQQVYSWNLYVTSCEKKNWSSDILNFGFILTM